MPNNFDSKYISFEGQFILQASKKPQQNVVFCLYCMTTTICYTFTAAYMKD